MSAMDDLAAWLTQIWDDQEAAARKAGGGGRGFADTAGEVYEHVREHINLHDPESVLARIAADRQILALHQPVDEYELVCSTCATREVAAELSADLYPCATVRLLALPNADRPGYREEWKP